jgi:hypothetical protein
MPDVIKPSDEGTDVSGARFGGEDRLRGGEAENAVSSLDSAQK